MEEQQSYLDLIVREQEKLLSLNHSHNVDLAHKKMAPKKIYCNDEAKERERQERIDFEEEIQREAKEKQILLQSIIRESKEMGCPLPPSLLKMLHSNNGKDNNNSNNKYYKKMCVFTYIFFAGTLLSMKQNDRAHGTTIRAVKQETKEIRSGVIKIENHMSHYNGGMDALTNYVKVNFLKKKNC